MPHRNRWKTRGKQFLEAVANLVEDDREQPFVEAAFLWVETAAGESQQHLLHDVGGVRILWQALVREAVDQRAVEFDELLPGDFVLVIVQTFQEGHARVGPLRHDGLPY